jgi:hypothetical protein
MTGSKMPRQTNPEDLGQNSSVPLREKLLADIPERGHEPQAKPPPVWPVIWFFLRSPMQCSRLRSFLTLFLGILSCVVVGGTLAGIGIYIGQMILALKNANEKDFNIAFLVLWIMAISAIVSKGCSEYFMRSVGQLKRTHLNSRLQTM